MTVDRNDPIFKVPGLILLWGPPGFGKSTETAKTFQNGLFLLTDPLNLRPYASLARDNPKLDLKWPLAQRVRDGTTIDAKGDLRPIDNWQWLRRAIIIWCNASHAGKNPYDALILDEATEFAQRIHRDMMGANEFRASSGNADGFAVTRAIKEFFSWLSAIPRSTGRHLVLVCHDKEPKFDEKTGKMQYQGGPQMPIGPLIKQIAAQSTFSLRCAVREDEEVGSAPIVRRVFETSLSVEYARKARDFAIAPEEPPDLKALLQKAGML